MICILPQSDIQCGRLPGHMDLLRDCQGLRGWGADARSECRMNSETSGSLSYPVFLVENDRTHVFTGYNVVRKPTDFTTFGRVPNSEKYSDGLLFDSKGRLFNYHGADGWPRFSPQVCAILDYLVLPGLLSKLLEAVFYFGPKLTSGEKLDLQSYKEAIIERVERFEKSDQPQLRLIIADKKDFASVIEGLDWWRFHGGQRDEDGHPV